ncbi:MAG: M20 family metallo-hydrolase, partial [bacterium]|nr:M20 family metallo-hydrolase [bacterium]
GLAGPTLLFASHLDTVPPGDGWTVNPFEGVVRGRRLIGRGAVDAKASIAAMAVAAHRIAQSGLSNLRGRLVFLATFGEETRLTTMPDALPRLETPPDAAIVGEPTGLQPAIAQRGLLLLKLVWSGEQMHAGRAATVATRPLNAITAAARDLVLLSNSPFDRVHPALGEVVATPTLIDAGVARNVTPPACEVVFDIRSTPSYSHAEITEQIETMVEAKVEVLSDRLRPAATPDNSRLLAAVLRACPAAVPFASPTCSDWAFMRHLDTVKFGPGDSSESHTADESIDLDEVEIATNALRSIAVEYLS